jgi:hypothetical protein
MSDTPQVAHDAPRILALDSDLLETYQGTQNEYATADRHREETGRR